MTTMLTKNPITRAALTALPLAALAAFAPTAQAAPPPGPVTGYNDLAAYNAATTTATVYDFENIAFNGFYSQNAPLSPLTILVDDVFDDPVYTVISKSYSNGSASLNGTDSLLGAYAEASNPTRATTTIVFGSYLNAFGTEFGFRGGSAGSSAPFATGAVSVQLFDGNTAIGSAFLSQVPGTSTFIGLTSTQAFDRAAFTTTALTANSLHGFDNVRIGPTVTVSAAAPEPGSIALLLTAGLPVAGLARRRKAAR